MVFLVFQGKMCQSVDNSHKTVSNECLVLTKKPFYYLGPFEEFLIIYDIS